ncbi:hypothetical protein PRIEUP_LOCUS1476 [Pristimantis euphronides]
MELSDFLLVVITTCALPGHAAVSEWKKYAAVASDFEFPPVKLTNGTVYDIRIPPRQLIFTHHRICNVRPPYNQRANFISSNGTFFLRNLTKDDSRTYEQVVNLEVEARIYLSVIDPVNKPILHKVNDTLHGGRCHVFLECNVQGPNPLNMTFHRDGEELTKDITRVNNSSYLSLDTSDSGYPGIYTCKVSNPVSTETSSEIKLPSPDDNNCKDAGSQNWSIIVILPIIATIIGVSFIVYFICLRKDGKSPRDRDTESGDSTEEMSQVELLLLKEERGRESSRHVSVTDSEELLENLTLNNDPELSTAEDIPENPDPGHCGLEEATTMEREVHGTASDHGQEENG